MKKYVLLLSLAFLVGLGAGCEPTVSPAVTPKANIDVGAIAELSATSSLSQGSSSSVDSEVPSARQKQVSESDITIDNVAAFLLNFQETADLLVSHESVFKRESVDPKLQAQHMENGSDVPLMRFLGRKGLNTIESQNLEERIAILKKQKPYTNFAGSVDRLEKSLGFLKRFYTELETLQSFEEFKLDTADMLAYMDAHRGIGDIFEREYGYLQTEYPDLNYQMTNSTAGVIVLLYSGPAVKAPAASAVAPVAPIFQNDTVPSAPATVPSDSQGYCCKICSKGKACGDSCISRSYTCHKAPGCACDAN